MEDRTSELVPGSKDDALVGTIQCEVEVLILITLKALPNRKDDVGAQIDSLPYGIEIPLRRCYSIKLDRKPETRSRSAFDRAILRKRLCSSGVSKRLFTANSKGIMMLVSGVRSS